MSAQCAHRTQGMSQQLPSCPHDSINRVYLQNKNVNKINNVISSIDEADISNLHIRIFFYNALINKVHNVADRQEKGEVNQQL